LTAARDVQSVSLRIRDHFEGGQLLGPGFDVKRGRGGIREVEFFTQIHQLIWGGRERALQVPATLEALRALVAAGRIDSGEADALAASYRGLRTLEHRLQMVRDEQTHSVPRLAAERAAVAGLCGAKDWPVVERALGRWTAPVSKAYDRLIKAAAPPATPVPAEAAAWLKAEYPKLAKVLGPLIERWRSQSLRSLRSETARAAFERVLPELIAGIDGAADPARAAARLDGFLEQLPPAAQFLALLEANPRLVELLTHLLGVAPVLADALARTPALFDVMLGPDALDPPPEAEALAAELALLVNATPDFEAVLDRVRRWTGERRFQIGAQLIEGHIGPLVAARALAGLADAALLALLPAVTRAMAEVHGHVPGAEPVVLAMGRYGGGMLTHASDLDLIYLYVGDATARSEGGKPIAAGLWFNRLAARLSTALSVPTAEGGLYEVDTRLRPWGAKGMLSVSLDSFARYEAEEAEAWEHMALTRARVIGGSDAARAAVEAVIAAQLSSPRDPEALRGAVVAMRADIAKAKPGQGSFDVKLGPGGLVDLEFVIHYLQMLTPEALSPDMHVALERLAACGRLDGARAAALSEALDVLTRWLVLLRLVVPGTKVPESFSPAVEAVLVRGLGAATFQEAVAELGVAKQQVRLAWEDVVRKTF
jgi:glutamate-ammonia-ligase adenylyltransferase